MKSFHQTFSPRRRMTLPLVLSVTMAVIALSIGSPATAQQGGTAVVRDRTYPPTYYFTILYMLDDGHYIDALKGFKRVWRGAIKDVDGRWIDSICYYTMIGETYHRMGNPSLALDNFSQALRLARAYNTWMLDVQQFGQIGPSQHASHLRPVPWGQRKQRAVPALVPDKFLISVGRINNNNVVRRGGVVRLPSYRSVRATEVVRCTALAMRRRREILGPVCKYHPQTSEIEAAFNGAIGPAGNWSQAWGKLLRGLAKASSGKFEEAISNLRQSILLNGRYEHPLSCIAQIEIGRLYLEANELENAAKYFADAAYSAFRYHEDIGLGPLEEALRYGQMTHIIAGKQGPYPPLASALEWANRKRYRELRVSLMTLLAEQFSAAGKPKQAVALLAQAKTQLGVRGMKSSRVAVRLEYQIALANYKTNNRRVADSALLSSLAFQRTASHRLLQIAGADRLWDGGNGRLTERMAKVLYGKVLAETTGTAWATDPLDALAVMTTPHARAMENWFEVALASKDHELAIRISELTRRHRFYNTLPLGGRLLTLRWLLEGPEDVLSQKSMLQRQSILARYPKYAQLSNQARQISADLKAAPLVPEGAKAQRKQQMSAETLTKISKAQEVILHEIALSRDPADPVFPALRSFAQMQQSLSDGAALWVFFATKKNLYSMMINNKDYDYWRVPNPDKLRGGIEQLLREMGNFGSNMLSLKNLTDTRWKQSSREIVLALTQGSKVELNRIPQEITIVPDGPLWYLPFGALQVGPEDQSVSLLSKIRVRYAPTASLAQPYSSRRSRFGQGHVAIKLGRLHPRDGAEVATEAFDRLKTNIPSAVALGDKQVIASPLLASLIDGLIVLDDIVPRAGEGPYDWSPTQLDRSRAAGALGHWFELPFGGPEHVILPGFHTAAETALKPDGKTSHSGNEVFLSVCGLMSTGARTILISRWRNGGKTSIDLVREFTQELPYTSAANAWQRSVQLATESPLDPEAEPRIGAFVSEKPMPADHPLLWSGYLLIDMGSPGRDENVQAAR